MPNFMRLCLLIVSYLKLRMFFREIDPKFLRIWLSIESSKEFMPKISRQPTQQFINFSKAFHFIHREMMVQILLANGVSKESVTAIMMLYKDMEGMVHSLHSDNDFFVTITLTRSQLTSSWPTKIKQAVTQYWTSICLVPHIHQSLAQGLF